MDLNLDWKQYQKLYPVNEDWIWLNNCGTTPSNSDTNRILSEFMDSYSRRGVFTDYRKYHTTKSSIRTILAKLLQCEPSELSLIHNTNEGMNFISLGLSLDEGDEILLLENEYPSNVYPWEHWAEKGIQLRTIPMAETPDEFYANFEKSVSERTKLVSISLVHWCTGMPLPIQRIGEFCKQEGIELCLDGAQGVGLLPIQLKEWGISYMAFPAWKWLLGPLGLGVLYVSEEKLNNLRFPFKGTSSVKADENYLPYKSDLREGTDRYEISTTSFLDWVYFQSTLEMLDGIGFDAVMQRIYSLADTFVSGLKSIGYTVEKDKFPDKNTGIVVCQKDGVSSEETVGYLKKNNVICAPRLGKVRFSPHIYNSEEQIDRVLQLLTQQ